MVPSQFQYKDLINHVLVGFLLLICICFFLYDFAPAFSHFQKGEPEATIAKFGLGSLLLFFAPVVLAISYTTGAVMGSCFNLIIETAYGKKQNDRNLIKLMIGRIKRFILKRVFKLREKADPRYIPFLSEIDNMGYYESLKSEIAGAFKLKIDNNISNGDLLNIFELCRSRVEMSKPSLAQADIDRHFVLMHFNSKLAIIFLVSFIGSLLALISSTLHFQIATSLNLNWKEWLLVCFLFYYSARMSANKTIRNHSRWSRLIYYSFYIIALRKKR